MTQCFERTNVVGGLFKIRGEKIADVLLFVSEWKDGSDGAYFERLAVRDCTGKTERDYMVAIEFLFVLTDGTLDEDLMLRMHNAFFQKYTDLLRRRFGNGLAIWDISTPIYEIVT
jgi:hypothetical protein